MTESDSSFEALQIYRLSIIWNVFLQSTSKVIDFAKMLKNVKQRKKCCDLDLENF
jgi:hypothetical protein